MDKLQLLAERARLQNLLDAYEADRQTHRADDKRRGVEREVTPDRADNVRARIARLDQLIAESDEA
ncbi:MAG: hypothetical protein ACJ8EH_09500 [Sphingomicrobium sp.]|jgi:hypothetical protein